jgi:hypothetical protein
MKIQTQKPVQRHHPTTEFDRTKPECVSFCPANTKIIEPF